MGSGSAIGAKVLPLHTRRDVPNTLSVTVTTPHDWQQHSEASRDQHKRLRLGNGYKRDLNLRIPGPTW